MRLAAAAGVGAAIVWIATWVQLWVFRQSFVDLSGTVQTVLDIIVVVLAAGVLTVPFFAVRALTFSFRARRLYAVGEEYDGRVAAARSREACWYVLGFGLTALVAGFAAFFLSNGEGSVRRIFLNPEFMTVGLKSLARAFLTNIKLFMVAEAIVLVWGLVVALVRMIPGRAGAPIRFLAVVYVDVFRGLPAILVIFLVVFGFQLAGVPGFAQMDRDAARFWLVVLALVLTFGAYVSEVYRAGLQSVHWGQVAAARSLGLNHVQTLRYVVVPQAFRRMVPPLLNDFIGLQKDTALAYAVGTIEIFQQANLIKATVFNLTPVVITGLFFLALTVPMARFTDWLIKKDQDRMKGGS
jgi:polar amino acid transport system permease protein